MLYILAVLVSLQLACCICLQFPALQTWAAHRVTAALSRQINGKISVGKVYIVFFNKVILNDISVVSTLQNGHLDSLKRDFRQSDTLLACRRLSVSLDSKELMKLRLKLHKVRLSGGVFNLQSEDSLTTNLSRIFRLDRNAPKDTAKKGSLNLLANQLRLDDFRFTLNNPFKYQFKGDSIINFSDLSVSGIQVNINNVVMKRDTLYADVGNISGIDKSGFKLAHLEGKARICGTEALISDLLLEDSYTRLKANYFYMRYNTPKDLSDFIHKVRMGIELDQSHLNFKTIGKIAPSLYNSSLQFILSGKAGGTVDNLRAGRLRVTSMSGLTDLVLSARIMGLPDITRTMAIAEIEQSSTTCQDLADIVASIKNTPRSEFLQGLSPLVTYRFTGGLSGLLDDFVADGTIESAIGKINLDMLFRNETDGVLFNGKLQTEDFNVGRLLSKDVVGEVSMNSFFKAELGKGGDIEVSMDSLLVDKLQFNGYDYSNLYASGEYRDKKFNGRIIAHDPNLNFLFQGMISLGKDGKGKYDFYANVPYANLAALHLDKRDPVSEISLLTTANFEQKGEKNIIGNITLRNTSFTNSRGNYSIGTVKLNSTNVDGRYTGTLTAPFADMQYSGASPISAFIREFLNQAIFSQTDNYLQVKENPQFRKGEHLLEAKTYNTMGICEMLCPGLYIKENTRLSISLDSASTLKMKAASGRIAVKQNYLKDMTLYLGKRDSSITRASLNARNIRFAGMRMDSSNFLVSARDNRIRASFDFKNDSTENNMAVLNAAVDLRPGRKIDVHILEDSGISLKGEKWELSPSAVFVDDSTITVDRFRIANREQEFALDGNISKYTSDTLNFSLKDFDIGIFNLFMDKAFDFKGYFSGNGIISDLYAAPKIFFDITGDSVYVYHNAVGRLKMRSQWDQQQKRLNVNLNTNLEGKPTLTVAGYYHPDRKYCRLNASLDELSVAYFEPFLESILHKSSGNLSGKLTLSGPLDALKLTGEDCRFKDFRFTIGYTNVPYRISGPVDISENGIFFKNVPIYDRFGSRGVINGNLTYRYFKDIAVDARLNFNNLECLSITEKENEFFYGDAFASGTLHVKGPLDKIRMDIDVLTDPRTAIHIPLSNSANAAQANLLTFKEPQAPDPIDPYDTLSINRKKEKDPTELDIHLNAELTPLADIMIEINKSVGDVIKANGNGNIRMAINPTREIFDIFGDYHINKGSYKFVLGGFAAKDFSIKPGGSINFNGDIANTNLNLGAVYTTKASINTLIADTSSVSTRRTVNCTIGMEGQLMNPSLKFDIDIPDLDPTTKIRVQTALNNQGKIQKQLMALVVSGGFIPDEQSGIANNSSILYSNASEILSNQINMIFQQLGIPIDLGLNYQPGDKGTDIFDVAVSTQLFNNRVIINGNIGNDPYASSSSRNVIGNIDVEVKLDKTGNLRLDLFSHAEDQFSSYANNTNSQRSGVGIVYQKEFNSFRQLFKRKSKAQKDYEKQRKEKEKRLKQERREKNKATRLEEKDRVAVKSEEESADSLEAK